MKRGFDFIHMNSAPNTFIDDNFCLFFQGTKKKKKKKLKVTISSDTSSPSCPVQTPSFSASAGVLFGARPDLGTSTTDQSGQGHELSGRGVNDIHCEEKVSVGEVTTEGTTGPGAGRGDTDTDPRDKELAQYPSLYPPQLTSINNRPGFTFGGDLNGTFDKFVNDLAERIHERVFVADNNRTEIVAKDYTKTRESNGSPTGVCEIACVQTPQGKKFLLDRLSESPEFKMPSYHRGKNRKLGETKPALSSQSSQCSEESLSDSLNNEGGKDNSTWPTQFFLSDNYLSENRFKFPASPASAPHGSPPNSRPGSPDSVCSCSVNGVDTDRSKRKHSTTSLPATGSNYSDQTSPQGPAGTNSKKDISLGPSFIAFLPPEKSHADSSSTTERNVKVEPASTCHTPSEISTSHHQSASSHSTSQAGKTSVSTTQAQVNGVNTTSTQSNGVNTVSTQSNGVNTSGTQGKSKKSKHTRQGSFPLDLLTKSGSSEKGDKDKVTKTGSIEKQNSLDSLKHSGAASKHHNKSRKSGEFAARGKKNGHSLVKKAV